MAVLGPPRSFVEAYVIAFPPRARDSVPLP